MTLYDHDPDCDTDSYTCMLCYSISCSELHDSLSLYCNRLSFPCCVLIRGFIFLSLLSVIKLQHSEWLK